MRGHYGDHKQAQCPVCLDPFTRKQPQQKYCHLICQERAKSRRNNELCKGRSVSARTLSAVRSAS